MLFSAKFYSLYFTTFFLTHSVVTYKNVKLWIFIVVLRWSHVRVSCWCAAIAIVGNRINLNQQKYVKKWRYVLFRAIQRVYVSLYHPFIHLPWHFIANCSNTISQNIVAYGCALKRNWKFFMVFHSAVK